MTRRRTNLSHRQSYLRGFADVDVGLLLAFTQVPQMEDGQFVFLLVRLGLQFLHTATHNRRSKQSRAAICPLRVFISRPEPRRVPGLARKSPPARYQSAGRDISGWLSLLWVGRDLGMRRTEGGRE